MLLVHVLPAIKVAPTSQPQDHFQDPLTISSITHLTGGKVHFNASLKHRSASLASFFHCKNNTALFTNGIIFLTFFPPGVCALLALSNSIAVSNFSMAS